MVDIPEQVDAPQPVSGDAGKGDRRVRNAVEWLLIVGGALITALLVKTFLLQAFFIPSLSMSPTLEEGDRVLVNKLSYDLHDVHRGDLVVFERPPAEPTGIKDLIKRVVALPGETIEARDGNVYVNGEPLDESYLEDGVRTDNLPRQVVPDGHLFVMGDNRANSYDSRMFGAIDADLVVGRAFMRVWPLTNITFF
jgi:signal peptidase I